MICKHDQSPILITISGKIIKINFITMNKLIQKIELQNHIRMVQIKNYEPKNDKINKKI